MMWAPKLNREQPCWHQFESAVAVGESEVAAEGLLVRCMWRPRIGMRPAALRLGLFALQGLRIYAVDVGPVDEHKNVKAGRGRPFWGKEVGGVHEHTWSGDGDGYAEPLDGLTEQNPQRAWALFTERTGLVDRYGFRHPESGVDFGQGSLL